MTQAVLDAGTIPYHSTVPSNVASMRVAPSLGYRPLWTTVCMR